MPLDMESKAAVSVSEDDAGVPNTVDTAELAHPDGTVDTVEAKIIGGDVGSLPKDYFRSFEFVGTVAAQCLASICAALGWVLPANTLSLINADIGPSQNIDWVGTAWTMGCSIGFLLVGRFSDLYGRKWIFMGATGLGLIGCILAATTHSVTQLIVANCFNGLAASGQLNFGVVLGELVPNKYRSLIIAVGWTSSLPFGTFGPVIARELIQNTAAGWRWTYYLGIMTSVVTLVLYQLAYHPPTFSQLHVGKTKIQQLKQLDIVGILLYISGTVLALIGLSWAGTQHAWDSAATLAPLLVGLLLLAAFLIYEAQICPVQPLVPPKVFRNTDFDAIIVACSVVAMLYFSLALLWPVIISTIFSRGIIQTGWDSCALGGGVLAGQIISAFGVSYLPRMKFQILAVSILVATLTTTLLAVDEKRWALTLASGLIISFGIGYVENVSVTGVTLVWEAQDIGLASGVLGTIRTLAGAFAQALFGSVMSSKLKTDVPTLVRAAAMQAGLSPERIPIVLQALAAGDLSKIPSLSPQVLGAVSQAEIKAYTQAFHLVVYATIPFSVLLLLGAAFFPSFDAYLTRHVAKRLRRGVARRNDKA